MLLRASYMQLYTFRAFNLLNIEDSCSVAPQCFGTFIKSPLNKVSDPEELSGINSELAIEFMGVPMIVLAILAAVVCRRRLRAIIFHTVVTTSAALCCEASTVCTFVV